MLDVISRTAAKVFMPLTVAAASAAWRISKMLCVPVLIKPRSIPQR